MKLFGKVLGKKEKVKRSDSIFFNKKGNSLAKEAIDRINDNLLYWAIDGDKKIVQFESSISGEAKTTTVVNLAVALGEIGKKVVVLDLDFRRPRVHRAFEFDVIDGISDYMIEKISYDEMLKATEYKNVSVITRGSSVQNPTAIFTSEKFAMLIQRLREEFDFVLVDCPPVLLVSDYIHIARYADGVLFNVAFASTKKAEVKEAIGLLKKNNVPIIGAIFTFYNPKKANNYHEYKYHNNYTYGDSDK